MQKTIYFYECEHDGDLENYKADVIASGAKIINAHLDPHAEEGVITIECEDIWKFKERFILTDSYVFSSLC
jgi:hypothetical protein